MRVVARLSPGWFGAPAPQDGQWAGGGGVMLSWLRRGIGGSGGSSAAALGVLDGILHPGAARAREHLDAQHERVMPSPTPGDKLLSDGVVVIKRPAE